MGLRSSRATADGRLREEQERGLLEPRSRKPQILDVHALAKRTLTHLWASAIGLR